MEVSWQDLRSGIGRLIKGPTFALLATVALALGIGAVAALAQTGVLRSHRFGLSGTEPVSSMPAAAVLASAAILASCVPARVATRMDPDLAIRYG